MPKHKQRPTESHQLARRFLQLDADIRLAAAAQGLFPFEKERPESPAQVYPYDANLQHPKPKPANGPIQIGQLEHVAKAKPSLKTRSVSDPGDAHRLISRFVARPEQKSRSMTVNASSNSRAFPFPSKGPLLENFIEMESTADEIGHDDPLALKMGQILARRAAAATRAISGSSRRSSRRSSVASGRRSVDSNGRRSIDSQRSRLRIESLLDAVGEGSKPTRDSALLVPPPAVVDDRSPQEGPNRFWPRAPKSKGFGVGGIGSANHQQNKRSPPGAHDSLNTFMFPSVQRSQSQSPPVHEPESEPQPLPPSHFGPSSHFGSQPPSYFGADMPSYRLHIQTQLPLTLQTNLDPPPASPVMFHEDTRSVSFVMRGSPTSGVYVSPVESLSPTSLRFSVLGAAGLDALERSFEVMGEMATDVEMYDDAMTSFDPVTTSPRTSRVQTSPTTTRVQNMRVQASPTAIRVQTSPTMMRATVHSSPTMTRAHASPAATRIQTSPTTTRIQPSPRFQGSPSTARFQHSPATSQFQNSPSTSRIQNSPYQNSPTAGRFQHHHQTTASTSRIPVARQMSSSDNRYHSSPTTVYSQPSPGTPFQSGIPVAVRSTGTPVIKPTPLRTATTPIQRPPSNAHLDLLRGLSPLPSHGLPLPAPMRNSLKRGSLLGDVFAGHSVPDFGDMSTLAVEDLSVLGANDSARGTGTAAGELGDLSTRAVENVSASNRSFDPTSPEEPRLIGGDHGPSIREWTPPPPATPTPPSTPLPNNSFSALGNMFSTPRNTFPSPNAVSTPVKSPSAMSAGDGSDPQVGSTTPIGPPPLFSARALSPIPARLRRTTPDPGSASDEVVFRGSSSSASSTPQKRKRRRTRLPVRAHSEGFIHIPSADFSRSGEPNHDIGRTRSGSGSARRTAQSLIRRRQTGDGGEVSSDGRDVVLFVPKSLGPPSRSVSPAKSRAASPAKSLMPSPAKSQMPSPAKSHISSSPTKLKAPSPTKTRIPSPVKQSSEPVAISRRPVPPPMIRRSSIPLPNASPTQLAPPPVLGLLGAEPFMMSSQELPRRPSIELREPIIVQPEPSQPLERLPWSPPRHMFSRMETASRDGSFHTARDSPAQSTEIEFPGSFQRTDTPVHMENQEESSTTIYSAITAEENPLVQSAVRGMVSRPVTMTITRRPSGEFVPSPPGSSTPARRAASVHSFAPSGLVPPVSLAPSPSLPGLSHTPNSSNGGCSIPVRHDRHYSPPESLPESVTPPTDASRPPTERSNSHPENESFYSAHAADSEIRLPVESWIAFTMGNMDANGVVITRATFDELQSSEDESAAVAEVLSRHSARRPDSAVILDDILSHDDDNDSGESAGQSLSDVGTTPSPSRSGSRHSGWLAEPVSTGANGHLTVQTSDLDWPEEDGNTSAFSLTSDTSESNRLTVDQLQTVASIVHELNVRTPIPSASSSHLRGPPSLATTSAAYVTPPSFANQPPYRSSHSAPSRTLSPGAVSITFSEASPSLSTIPPPSLVVPSENRNWFADSLVLAEYRHSLHYLRDDDQRALEEGEDVILYGGDWEHVGRRSESRATTDSAIPIDAPIDYVPSAIDRQSRNKYIQFVLSVAGALRTGAPPRPQRMVESVLRPLRRQPSQPNPSYEDSYEEIDHEEAGVAIPPPPHAPSDLSITSSSSSDTGSALPEDDEIVEEFVRSIMTPQPGTPHRPPPPILIQGSNVLPWPALPSPVSPRIRFTRSVSRQTTRSQATSITHITSSHSGYSSLIPPPPRPRPRSLEPHWLTIYVAGRWPIPDTYVTRRTYSSPSALGPPMPYLWRPICHISPERLWEITNFEPQIPIHVQPPTPAYSPQEPPNARQHFTTPATTQNHATTYSTYSISTSSTASSRSNMMLPPPPTVYPDVGFQMSHANLQIDSLSALPPLPPSVPTLMERQLSNISIPASRAPNHLASRLSLGSSISSPSRPSTHPRSPSNRIVTPVAMSRRRTLKEFVGKITGRGARVRTHSIHSRTSSPFVPKPKFGVAGKVVEIGRRIFRRGRRSRLESIRSQVQRASPET